MKLVYLDNINDVSSLASFTFILVFLNIDKILQQENVKNDGSNTYRMLRWQLTPSQSYVLD